MFFNERKAILLINKWKAKEGTFMEERGLLTRKRKEEESEGEKEGKREERKKSFDSLDKSVGELGKSEKIII